MLKVFSNKKSKKLERGIAFPTCISVNNICGHYSPCPEDSTKLVNEDLVKIEFGAHMDGYPANVAHTLIIGGKAKDKKAAVTLAAYDAFIAGTRLIKSGGTNQEVTAAIQKICTEYGVEPLQGVLSHKVKKHLIDGNEVIINKETPEQRVDDWEFAPGDVIAFDVYVASGDGMGREADMRTTVYKREMEMQYSLKSTRARAFFSEVNKKYPCLPFSIRGFEDLTGAKLGVRECVDHELLMGYPVLQDKTGEVVARFGGCVVVQPKSTAILCGPVAINREELDCPKSIQDAELKTLIASELWKEEKVKKEKK